MLLMSALISVGQESTNLFIRFLSTDTVQQLINKLIQHFLTLIVEESKRITYNSVYKTVANEHKDTMLSASCP